MHPVTSRIKLLSHSLNILSALNKDLGARLKHVERFARSGGKHSWQRGGVCVCCCCNTLMSHHVRSACAESTTGAERTCEGANDHVYLGGVNILGFRETSTRSPKNTKGPCLIQHKAEFVAEFELDLGRLGQVM
jgi:hypothetical protein